MALQFNHFFETSHLQRNTWNTSNFRVIVLVVIEVVLGSSSSTRSRNESEQKSAKILGRPGMFFSADV